MNVVSDNTKKITNSNLLVSSNKASNLSSVKVEKSENMVTIDDILNRLSKHQEGIHIDNIDPTWNLNNELVTSRQVLIILLSKVSNLPIVPNFTDESVLAKLNISKEKGELIESFNSRLIYVGGIVQKYIIKNYIMLSVLSKMMSETIENIPTTDISELLIFLENYQKNKTNIIEQQKGGQMLSILRYIVLLYLLLNIQGTPNNNLAIIEPVSKEYSKGLINLSPSELTEGLIQSSPMSSGQIEINKVITKYDEKQKQELSSSFGQIVSIFKNMPNGMELLNGQIDKLNSEFKQFSLEAENSCLDLMVKSHTNGIFKEWTSIDTIEETKEKLNDIDKNINDNQKATMQEFTKNVIGATATSLSVPMTGDIATPALLLSNLGTDIYKLISNTNVLIEEKSKIMEEKKSMIGQEETKGIKMSVMEKMEFENKIYEFSKIYCSLGFNLQLVTSDSSLTIEGDNVPYISMIHLLETLNDNLSIKITELSTSSINEETKIVIKGLISLKQRLDVLKQITEHLSSVVNFSGKIHIDKINRYATADSISDLKEYFESQLSILQNMLVNLNKQFPQREQKILETGKLIEQDAELKIMEQNLEDMKQNASAIIRQRDAERSVREKLDWWYAVETYSQGWSEIGLGAVNVAKYNIGKYTEAIGDVAGEVPKQIVKSVLNTTNEIMNEIINSPSTWWLILIGLTTLELTFGSVSGTIRTFKKGGEMFIAIVVGGICFVYKLIKTPFGFIWKQIGATYIPASQIQGPNNLGSEPMDVEPHQLALPAQQPTASDNDLDDLTASFGKMRMGGKKKKTHKNKNKRKQYKTKKRRNVSNKKTKKHKKNKKRNTTKRH